MSCLFLTVGCIAFVGLRFNIQIIKFDWGIDNVHWDHLEEIQSSERSWEN